MSDARALTTRRPSPAAERLPYHLAAPVILLLSALAWVGVWAGGKALIRLIF